MLGQWFMLEHIKRKSFCEIRANWFGGVSLTIVLRTFVKNQGQADNNHFCSSCVVSNLMIKRLKHKLSPVSICYFQESGKEAFADPRLLDSLFCVKSGSSPAIIFIFHMLLTEQRRRMWTTQGHRGRCDTALWESMMMYDASVYLSHDEQSSHKTPRYITAAPLLYWLFFSQTINVPVSHSERGRLTWVVLH